MVKVISVQMRKYEALHAETDQPAAAIPQPCRSRCFPWPQNAVADEGADGIIQQWSRLMMRINPKQSDRPMAIRRRCAMLSPKMMPEIRAGVHHRLLPSCKPGKILLRKELFQDGPSVLQILLRRACEYQQQADEEFPLAIYPLIKSFIPV
jgi:hypothetical protein